MVYVASYMLCSWVVLCLWVQYRGKEFNSWCDCCTEKHNANLNEKYKQKKISPATYKRELQDIQVQRRHYIITLIIVAPILCWMWLFTILISFIADILEILKYGKL